MPPQNRSPNSKVFIVNKSGHDFSMAKQFGELIFLSEGKLNKLSVNHMFREFNEQLCTSSPSDLILPTGLSIMTGVACGIFGAIHGRLNLLVYVDKKYVERRIILKGE